MFKNIIFDWSGTLANDLGPVLEATNAVFAHYGKAPYTLEEFKANFWLPYPEFYAKVLPHAPLDELQELFRQVAKESQEEVFLLPHAHAFLEYCREEGIRCFALTSVDEKAFERQLAHTGMASYFEEIYSGVLNKCEVIKHLLDSHGLDVHETAFIGDMVHDVETAAHAGITSIAVLTGYQNATQLAEACPDVMIPHLGILQALLEKRRKRACRCHQADGKREPVLVVEESLIHITDLSLSCFIGVPKEERRNQQTLLASLKITPMVSFFGTNDDLSQTLDYAEMVSCLEREAVRCPRLLVETLATDLCQCLFDKFNIKKISLRLDKAILEQTRFVGVEVSVSRV